MARHGPTGPTSRRWQHALELFAEMQESEVELYGPAEDFAIDGPCQTKMDGTGIDNQE